MGLVMEFDGSIDGYEAVPLPRAESAAGSPDGGASVLRRRTARPSKRAVVYVHCLDDAFVPGGLVTWYTDRGFHFYAADLRTVSNQPGGAQDGGAVTALTECFACLDAAVTHLREVDAIETVVISAHSAGALIAALWCHARRDSQLTDALILVSPDLGTGPLPLGQAPALRASAQRRLRRGLDITCPVLVMCPSTGWDVPGGPGGLLAWRAWTGRRAIIRLGAHVTWLKMDGVRPGQAPPGGQDGKQFADEIGRWLGAYLSGQIRDQLL